MIDEKPSETETALQDEMQEPDMSGPGACFLLILLLWMVWVLFCPGHTIGKVQHVFYQGKSPGASSRFTITFTDGRDLELYGIPQQSLLVGKSYDIGFNNLGWIRSVKEVDNDNR